MELKYNVRNIKFNEGITKLDHVGGFNFSQPSFDVTLNVLGKGVKSGTKVTVDLESISEELFYELDSVVRKIEDELNSNNK